MKKVIIFFFFIIAAVNGYADCAGSGLWAWPVSKKISRNPVIILEGYAHSQKIITALNKKHAVYLRSGNQIVKLNVTETNVGGFELTQALLKPVTLLDAGKEYVLCVDSLAKYDVLQVWDETTKKFRSPSWTVTNETDEQAPVWTKTPAETGKTLVHYGCGPAIGVNFNFSATDLSELLIRTVVKNGKTNQETVYYVKTQNNKISIGHGMCSGEFDFNPVDAVYTVTFQLMDGSGNKSKITTPVSFSPPTAETVDGD